MRGTHPNVAGLTVGGGHEPRNEAACRSWNGSQLKASKEMGTLALQLQELNFANNQKEQENGKWSLSCSHQKETQPC